jgi:hypothetical protein
MILLAFRHGLKAAELWISAGIRSIFVAASCASAGPRRSLSGMGCHRQGNVEPPERRRDGLAEISRLIIPVPNPRASGNHRQPTRFAILGRLVASDRSGLNWSITLPITGYARHELNL